MNSTTIGWITITNFVQILMERAVSMAAASYAVFTRTDTKQQAVSVLS